MTLITRIIAVLASLAAAGCLISLREDRGARSARLFLALGFLLNAAMWAVSAIIRPLETFRMALFVSAVARGLFVWVAIGTIILVRQRRLLRQNGM